MPKFKIQPLLLPELGQHVSAAETHFAVEYAKLKVEPRSVPEVWPELKQARPKPEAAVKVALGPRPEEVDLLQWAYLACLAYQAPCPVASHQDPSSG